MGDKSDTSPLIPPSTITEPSEIDLEAGPGEQIQCRICLETDGNCSEITQFCKTFFFNCTRHLLCFSFIYVFASYQ